MPFLLNSEQQNELQILLNSFPETTSPLYSENLNYFEMYELVLSYINAFEAAGNTLNQDELVSKIWLEGVIGVNRGDTAQSDFIRTYNSKQSELRFGESISDSELNIASDKIALSVIDRILSTNTLPPVSVLAGEDVNIVSTQLLNDEDSAWAGNPLLLFLNYSDTYDQNIISDGSSALSSDPIIIRCW